MLIARRLLDAGKYEKYSKKQTSERGDDVVLYLIGGWVVTGALAVISFLNLYMPGWDGTRRWV